MARSMFSPGMFPALAASMAVLRRGLPPGSPPPLRAATVISRITLVQEEARLASVIAFLRLICFHLLCPAMAELLGDYRVWMTEECRCGIWKHKSRTRLGQREASASVTALCHHSATGYAGSRSWCWPAGPSLA